jgi:hypothetical protein
MGNFSKNLKKSLSMKNVKYVIDLNVLIKDFDGESIPDHKGRPRTVRTVLTDIFLSQQNEKIGSIEKMEAAKLAENIYYAKAKEDEEGTCNYELSFEEFETAKQLIKKMSPGIIILQMDKVFNSCEKVSKE